MIIEFSGLFGRVFINFILSAGRLGMFFSESLDPIIFSDQSILPVKSLAIPPYRLFFLTCGRINSLLSSGMVLALQSYTGFSRSCAEVLLQLWLFYQLRVTWVLLWLG